MALLWAESSPLSEAVGSLPCGPGAMLAVTNVHVANRGYSHSSLHNTGSLFLRQNDPTHGAPGGGGWGNGEDILKGIFSGNDHKAEPRGRQADHSHLRCSSALILYSAPTHILSSGRRLVRPAAHRLPPSLSCLPTPTRWPSAKRKPHCQWHHIQPLGRSRGTDGQAP